jgi:hypothetical protein
MRRLQVGQLNWLEFPPPGRGFLVVGVRKTRTYYIDDVDIRLVNSFFFTYQFNAPD